VVKAHRRQLVDPKIYEHHGRIVKTTGDGLLVEFPSVVDAVRCAIEVQRAMVNRNAEIVARCAGNKSSLTSGTLFANRKLGVEMNVPDVLQQHRARYHLPCMPPTDRNTADRLVHRHAERQYTALCR
jgi:hypothetical protein